MTGVVAALGGEFAPTPFGIPAAVLRAGGTVEVAALPAPGWSIRVIDPDGRPVAGARVRPQVIGRKLTVMTDGEGRVDGPHARSSMAVLMVAATGFQTEFATFPETDEEMTIALRRTEPFYVRFGGGGTRATETAAVGVGVHRSECDLVEPGRFRCGPGEFWPQRHCGDSPFVAPLGNSNVVQGVPIGGPAWRAGLRPGEHVRSVDGRDVSRMVRGELHALLDPPVGSSVTVEGTHWNGEAASWSVGCD